MHLESHSTKAKDFFKAKQDRCFLPLVSDRQILLRLGLGFPSLRAIGGVICVDSRCPLKLRVCFADDRFYVVFGTQVRLVVFARVVIYIFFQQSLEVASVKPLSVESSSRKA